MKKNFMAIASLLIAAMLLVVSCAPEANVEGKVEDNGLVNASLMATAAGKALTVSYPTNEALSYTITLDAKWDKNSEYKMDEIVGEKTINYSSLPSSIDLGWISQGLWTVTVEGTRTVVTNGEAKKETVVYGSTTKYITKDNKDVVVFLGTKTDSEIKTLLDFDITVNELAANNNDGYSLKAIIAYADGRNLPPNEVSSFSDTPNGNNTRTYKITNDKDNPVLSLTPGYYKVTVQLLNGTNVIGGITKGVFVKGESTITIKGSVSASDFAKGSLAVIEPEVTISGITAKKDVTEYDLEKNADDLYEGIVELPTSYNDESYTITYAVTHSTPTEDQDGVTISRPTYTWTVDGETPTEEKATITGNSITVNYTAPGFKNVTCLVTYVCTVNINGTEYDFTFGNEAVASVLVKGPTVAGEVTTQTP